MGEQEITAFLTHLAVAKNVAASTQNQALAAILFLYKEVLRQELAWLDNVVRAKRPVPVPEVLSAEQVRWLLGQLEGVHQLIARLLYGTGMRIMEALRLRVQDVDFHYRQITVRNGKGGKDRVTVLPAPRPLSLSPYLAQQTSKKVPAFLAVGRDRGRVSQGLADYPVVRSRNRGGARFARRSDVRLWWRGRAPG